MARLSRPKEPIFTLPVPGARIYVVTDPALAAAVQRNSKTLSFTPLVPDITKRVLGLNDETVKVVRQNLDPEPGDARGFLADMHDLVYSALGPGQYLTQLSCEASQELCLQLSQYSRNLKVAEASPIVDLLGWVRHNVAVGTANYLFGQDNPIGGNSELENDFWAFDHGLGGLLVGIAPSITVPQAYHDRERVVKALMQYLHDGHDRSASKLVQDRIRLERSYDMSDEMIARSALSFLFAGIVNTTTTTFWIILRLFADVELLAQVRAEVGNAIASTAQNSESSDVLSLNTLKDNCPVLTAVFRESLRLGSENFSVRLIKEDTMLADKYFLAKGSVVQIAGGVIHADKSIWGEDVDEFNPNRFLDQTKRGGGFHPAAFRGFGGGKTLCPGRHFAINEILVFAAMIAYGFDLTSDDQGPISVPAKNDRVMPVHILEPGTSDRPKVVIKCRPEIDVVRRLEIVP